MNPILKWPGGKSGEIDKIKHLIPEYDRYIEPFFGGGALYFYLQPQKAAINDVSTSLIEFYTLIKEQSRDLHDLLMCYNDSFVKIISLCDSNYIEINRVYNDLKQQTIGNSQLTSEVEKLSNHLTAGLCESFKQKLVLSIEEFEKDIKRMVKDKMLRTVRNEEKREYSAADLKENLVTGFTSGYYMYFRKVFNDLNLKRIAAPSLPYKAANFYFIREYCYGSMFRYNAKGEFNIPYGGMSYNKKKFINKIESMFNEDVEKMFVNTEIHCSDFESFIKNIKLKNTDFMFLDPPYDTEFSDYEGVEFSKKDQERLASSLRKTAAQFILVIKNTDFIYNLYKDGFNILTFDNQYTYNVRSRNERKVEHLIITNIPTK